MQNKKHITTLMINEAKKEKHGSEKHKERVLKAVAISTNDLMFNRDEAKMRYDN